MKRLLLALKLTLISGLFLTSCNSWLPNIGDPPPPPPIPTKSYDYEWTKTNTPVVPVETSEGTKWTPVPVATSETLSVKAQETTPKDPPKTFFQKMKNLFIGLGTLGIILFILLFIFSPATAIGFFFWLWRRARRMLRETIWAIEESKAIESPEVKQALERNQSKSTKIAIKKIKESI